MHSRPRASDDEVQRLVQREFAAAEEHLVWPILNAYGTETWHVEENRVRIAAIKLACGDLRELERQIAVALVDFRDVVGAAESPSLMQLGFTGMERAGKEAVETLGAEDLERYEEWVRRP